MRPPIATLLALVIPWAVPAQHSRANDRPPRADLRFVAIDVREARVLWTFKPETMGDAHSEVYGDVVVLFPDHPQRSREEFFVLDRKTGARLQRGLPKGEQPLARSAVFYPASRVVTQNGLELKRFSKGNTKDLSFFREGSEKPEVVIRQPWWPHNVCAFRNLVIFDFGSSADEAVVYAYDLTVPHKPTWTLDLNRHITGSLEPTFHGLQRHVEGRKTRMHKQLLDGRLYVNAEEHLFCIEPSDGAILWQRNLAKDLGLRFIPDFFEGGLNIAPMAKEKDVLIVAFENRVVAYDEKRKTYLWWAMPDTSPHTPFPALHAGVLYVNAGEKLKIQRLE